MNRKTKILTLSGVTFFLCIASSLILFKDVAIPLGAETYHNGFHYAKKDPTVYESGWQEYWICCHCHEVFLNKPVGGTFKDGSEQSMLGGKPSAGHLAYLPKLEDYDPDVPSGTKENLLAHLDDFENQSLKSWSGESYSTLSIDSNEHYNGAYSLKSSLNSGKSQNMLVYTANTSATNDGFLEPEVKYTISFAIKGVYASQMDGVMHFNYSRGGYRYIYPIIASRTSVSTSWSVVSFSFSYKYDENNDLRVTYRRPNAQSDTETNIIPSLPSGGSVNGDFIKNISFHFFTLDNSQTALYLDDFKIEGEYVKTSGEQNIFYSDFNDEDIQAYSSSTSTLSTSIAFDSDGRDHIHDRNLKRFLNSKINTGSTYNDIRFTLTPTVSEDWFTLNTMNHFNIKVRGSGDKIKLWMVVYYGGENRSILLLTDSKSSITPTYKEFNSDFKFSFTDDNKLVTTFRRDDMSSFATDTALNPGITPKIEKIIFAFQTASSSSQICIDHIKISHDFASGVSLKTSNVINHINAIGDVTSAHKKYLNKVSNLYDDLEIGQKNRVFNKDTLFNALNTFNTTYEDLNVNFDSNNVKARFGLVSDIHNSENIPTAMQILSSYHGGMDALVISGDLTDGVRYYGTGATEINQVKSKIVNNVKADLPIITALGNHDTNNASHTALFYDTLGSQFYPDIDDPSLARNKGLYHSKVKGYHFISLECNYDIEDITNDAKNYLESTLAEITHDPSYKGEYIFVIDHLIPSNTIHYPSAATSLENILKEYPQVIVCAGHNHNTLYDENNINQNTFTTVNPGSCLYSEFEKTKNYIECTKNNEIIYGNGYSGYNLPTGIMIEIDENENVRFNRLDFSHTDSNGNHDIAKPWTISAPKSTRSHLLSYTNIRRDINNAPTWSNPDVTSNYDANNKKINISFNAASDDEYIYQYAIDVYASNGATPVTYYSIVSSEFYLHPDLSEMDNGRKSISITNIASKPYAIKVRALDNWSKEVSSNLILL